MLNIALWGGQGKMVRQCIDVLNKHPKARCSLVVYKSSAREIPGYRDNLPSGIKDDSRMDGHPVDVVIDFSSPAGVREALLACQRQACPLVIGVTGMDEPTLALIAEASKTLPILVAPNTSVGVSLLRVLTKIATHVMGPLASYEIVETHHRFKKDAPSGTALSLGESIASVLNKPLYDLAAFDKSALKGESAASLQKEQIGFSSLRLGSVVGDHSVFIAKDDEVIELKHSCQDRRVFAQGAIQAAQWLFMQPAGLYTMDDVLGIAQLIKAKV